ncbi:MAG: GyrI-like domain-containing protein [Armatimonadota bacterium]|jgi:DNA gyrase inhibitor GyrI
MTTGKEAEVRRGNVTWTVLVLAALLTMLAAGAGPAPREAPVGGLFQLAWTSSDLSGSYCVRWADYDGDGAPDLTVGNKWGLDYGDGLGLNELYRNNDGELVLAWTGPHEPTESDGLDWADWDDDGDVDLAVGNDGQPNRVYANDGGELNLAWESEEVEHTIGVAWGDWDGDGDPDLAVVNAGKPNRLYENTGTGLALAWSSGEADRSEGIAWADWDGDGDLDLAVGNFAHQPNRLYENTGGGLELAWSSAERDNSLGVAWGDWDGDGDPDLAVANEGEPNRVYENTGGDLVLAWTSESRDRTRAVAWGDYDGDGDPDLAVANEGGPNRVYENTGGNLVLAWSSEEADRTICVAWADYDGDGDLDLACANKGRNRLYRNMTSERKGESAMAEPGFTEARLPDMSVASFRYVGKSPEGGAMDGLFGWAAREHLLPCDEMPRFFGFNNPGPKEGSEEYGYEVWMTVDRDVEGADGVEIKAVPGGLYATTGPMDGIGPLWKTFRSRFSSWAEENGYEYDTGRQWLEEHLTTPEEIARATPDSWAWDWKRYALWVPIKPAGD